MYFAAMHDDENDLEWALEHMHELKSKEHIALLRNIIERAASLKAVFSAARVLAGLEDLGSIPFLLLALDRLWNTREPVHWILVKAWGLIQAHKPDTWSYMLAQLDSPNEARQYNAESLTEALVGKTITGYWWTFFAVTALPRYAGGWSNILAHSSQSQVYRLPWPKPSMTLMTIYGRQRHTH